jgi:RecJ-like exonuclease
MNDELWPPTTRCAPCNGTGEEEGEHGPQPCSVCGGNGVYVTSCKSCGANVYPDERPMIRLFDYYCDRCAKAFQAAGDDTQA